MNNIPDWMANPPRTLLERVTLLKKHAQFLHSPGPKGMFLRTVLNEAQKEQALLVEQDQQQKPLHYFKPSYEQALLLNAWLYGISFLCIYCANRIGKSTAAIINILLWIIPNDPKWRIFQPYRVGQGDDIDNRDNPHKGRLVQVLPRPDISTVKKINRLLRRLPRHIPPPDPYLPHYHPQNQRVLQWLQKQDPSLLQAAFPNPPWNRSGTIWYGAPDHNKHTQEMMPLWREYVPKRYISRDVDTDREFTFSIQYSPDPENPKARPRTNTWKWIGKSYESKDTKWASGAVDIIAFTEGITRAIYKEAKLRFKDPGIGSHDFTPYEPANAGQATALAYQIFKGKEVLPVPYAVFSGSKRHPNLFSLRASPKHIVTEDKRQGIIKSYESDPEGKARIDGEFYTNSGLVLEHLDRDIHLLPWTPAQLFQRFPTGRIYRGFDPGMDHPTAISWGLLTPTNVWIFYRIRAQRGLVIEDRARLAIEASNNVRARVYYGPQPNDFYYVEAHTNPDSERVISTIGDFHMFQRDQTTGLNNALNYQIAGLNLIESGHMGPEDRAILLDSYLKPTSNYPHLLNPNRPGPRIYFLDTDPGIKEFFLKMEEFYWEKYKGGDNQGLPKDKIPSHRDDELDAVCYPISSPIKWTPTAPPAIMINDSEPDERLIEASMNLNQRRSRLQSLQSQSNAANAAGQSNLSLPLSPSPRQEIVYFGGQPGHLDDDDDDTDTL